MVLFSVEELACSLTLDLQLAMLFQRLHDPLLKPVAPDAPRALPNNAILTTNRPELLEDLESLLAP